MTRLSTALFSAMALGATLVAQTPAAKPLDIYVVDTEGGKAALFVSPTGQSLLIDSGNPGGRDTDRLMAAVTEAGLKQIDYLICTHYHVDHIGGMAELVKRIPVGTSSITGPRSKSASRCRASQASVCGAVRQGQASRREAGRQDPDHRPRLAHRDRRRQRAQDAAAGRRAREPAVRRLQAEGDHQRSRERAVGRQRDDARPVPRARFRRPALEQGARADVPEQSDRHDRPVHGLAPRAGPVEFAGAGAGAAAARRDDAERHPQRRRHRRRCRRCGPRPASKTSGSCTGATVPGIEQNSAGVFIANVDDNATIAGI